MLRAREFVSAAQHGHALGENQGRQKIAHLPLAHVVNGRIVRRSFDAHVPGIVVVGAIGIVIAVRLVVLFVVAHQVAQRESIMRCDEVD